MTLIADEALLGGFDVPEFACSVMPSRKNHVPSPWEELDSLNTLFTGKGVDTLLRKVVLWSSSNLLLALIE